MSAERSLQPVRLPLVTLTPLFLGGADPRGQPELRASSVRGALRFWLRALLGGCYGTDEVGLREVREQEARVFGEAGGTGKIGASRVVLRVDEHSETTEEWNPGQGDPTYLMFGMQRLGNQPARSYVTPGSCWTLTVSTRAGVAEGEAKTALSLALEAAWLLIHLGGIGARSRRAAGSLGLQFRSIKTPDGVTRHRPVQIEGMPFHLKSSVGEAARQLGEKLTELRGQRKAKPWTSTSLPSWEVLHPDYCKIWLVDVLGKPLPDSKGKHVHLSHPQQGGNLPEWKQVMLHFQEFLRSVRSEFKDLRERAIFGAPLRKTPAERIRRASPLYLSVTQRTDGHLLGVVTLFLAQPYPTNDIVHANAMLNLVDKVNRHLKERFSDNFAEVHYE